MFFLVCETFSKNSENLDKEFKMERRALIGLVARLARKVVENANFSWKIEKFYFENKLEHTFSWKKIVVGRKTKTFGNKNYFN